MATGSFTPTERAWAAAGLQDGCICLFFVRAADFPGEVFSSLCRDGFRLHDGLLPRRGGEGVQTHQCRDREAAPARQESRKAGAEAAAAG